MLTEEVIPVGEAIGNLWTLINALHDLVRVYDYLGDYQRARACLQQAIVLAERFYRNGEAIAYRSRRVLEVAAACLQGNSQERLKPVLEAFGILGDSGQQMLNFEEGSDDD